MYSKAHIESVHRVTFCCEVTCTKWYVNQWRVLYKCEWLWSILLLNCNILFTSDPTLTTETMLLATDGVQMPSRAGYFGEYLDMPKNTYDKIVSKYGTGREGRRQMFSEFLSHHPYPRWELVVELLEKLEHKGKARATLAQEVKEKYLTSE